MDAITTSVPRSGPIKSMVIPGPVPQPKIQIEVAKPVPVEHPVVQTPNIVATPEQTPPAPGQSQALPIIF